MVKASYICTIVEAEWSKFAHLDERAQQPALLVLLQL